jgi:hypothetical protein
MDEPIHNDDNEELDPDALEAALGDDEEEAVVPGVSKFEDPNLESLDDLIEEEEEEEELDLDEEEERF